MIPTPEDLRDIYKYEWVRMFRLDTSIEGQEKAAIAGAIAVRDAVLLGAAEVAEAEENRYYHEHRPGMQDHYAITAKWLRSLAQKGSASDE